MQAFCFLREQTYVILFNTTTLLDAFVALSQIVFTWLV
jgi:hypothetical protein